jgi:hypothetical protein
MEIILEKKNWNRNPPGNNRAPEKSMILLIPGAAYGSKSLDAGIDCGSEDPDQVRDIPSDRIPYLVRIYLAL